MNLCKKLAGYEVFLRPHDTTASVGHRAVGRWVVNNSNLFTPSMNAPQPRRLDIPPNQSAALYLPSEAYHRIRILINNAAVPSAGRLKGRIYTQSLGYITLIDNPLPNNNFATYEYDAKQYLTNEYRPTLHQILCETNTSTSARVCDIAVYAYAPVANFLTELSPVATQYEISVFAPLCHNRYAVRTLNSRAYKLTLLAPRTSPELDYLLSLREQDELEIEVDNRYLPCIVQSCDSQPAGGALWQIQMQLAATSSHAYDPIRYAITHAHSSTADAHGYNLPGNAPAPLEVRVLINAVDANSDIKIHAPAAQAVVTIKPDSVGTWSLHDSGRIYHIPASAPNTIVDRTDILKRGALPIITPPGEGYISIEHSSGYAISYVALAAYPRYQPETVL